MSAFVAQWLEHLSRKQGVVSSILTEGKLDYPFNKIVWKYLINLAF